jgi:hypothetical protein
MFLGAYFLPAQPPCPLRHLPAQAPGPHPGLLLPPPPPANGSGDLSGLAAGAPGGADPCAQQRPPQFRPLLPFEDAEGTKTCNIVVMEVGALTWMGAGLWRPSR